MHKYAKFETYLLLFTGQIGYFSGTFLNIARGEGRETAQQDIFNIVDKSTKRGLLLEPKNFYHVEK